MDGLYYVARNGLMFAYRALRAKDRYAGQVSPYEEFLARLSEVLNPQRRTDLCVPYGDVEAFYQGSISEEEFVSAVYSRVVPKTSTISELSALFPLVWDVYTSVPAYQSLCQKIPRLCGRQLWEIFLKLDREGRSGVHIDDVCDLVMRIFKANGHHEKQENIQEWFCGETYIDFWSLMLALAETYSSFLQPSIIQELYDTVMLEVLMRGKLTKKGHMIHSWRDRYFILTSNSLTYYETQESLVQKGSIAITASTQMQFQPDTKNYQNRFKVVDGLSGTPYEISAPNPQTLHQWNDAIQLAIKIQQVNGRNFLHSYRLAKESLFPDNTAATGNGASAAARRTPSPATTDNAHKSLMVSKSVPLLDEKPQPKQHKHKVSSPSLTYKLRRPSPVTPTTSPTRVPNGHVPRRLDESLNDPPPLPPQKFSDDSNLQLQGAIARRPRKQREDGRVLRRRHSSILQHSDLEKVDHFSVGEDNYAVVKKKVSLPHPPEPVIVDESPPEQRATLEVREQRAKVSPASSPRQPRKPPGYVQLEFQSDKLKGQVMDDSPLPRDVKNRYGYSTIVFDNEPKKDVALARELRKKKPLPALPPRYDRQPSPLKPDKLPSPLKPDAPTSETSPRALRRKEKSSEERTAVQYADVTFTNPGPPKPDSLASNRSPRLGRKHNGGHVSLDYADIDFSSTAGSPTVPNRKVSSPGPGSGPGSVPGSVPAPAQEPPYVNVVHQTALVPPRIPPRQRPTSPSHQNPPPLPLKKRTANTKE